MTKIEHSNMNRTLLILFPSKEPDTGHKCFEGGCPLYAEKWVKEGRPTICQTLWNTPPHHKQGKLACMCNYYDTLSPTFVEADGADIQEVIKRISGKEDYANVRKILANAFMDFLDEIRTEGKMCLSNLECADIDKAFMEQDWNKIERYYKKYSNK